MQRPGAVLSCKKLGKLAYNWDDYARFEGSAEAG